MSMIRVLVVLASCSGLGVCCRPAAAAQQQSAARTIHYEGTWKWTTRRGSGSLSADVTPAGKNMLKGKFVHKKKTYDVDMKIKQQGGAVLVEGTSQVGGSTFTLQGRIQRTTFEAVYQRGKDKGSLSLTMKQPRSRR